MTFFPDQALSLLAVIAPQAQFRSDDLLEAIHGGLGYQALREPESFSIDPVLGL
jgi:hypothetical protein